MFVFSLSLYLMYVCKMFNVEELIMFKSYYEIKLCSVICKKHLHIEYCKLNYIS